MVELIRHIPTNVITGFLGVGKTTAILHLLENKPDNEHWAVLVNEFGKIGIDGSILASQDVSIKEIAGGCMCCAAGVSVQVGLNALLAQARPDRLIIEPTGIGHPSQIIRQLSRSPFDQVLDMCACLTLIDPRHLHDPRYTDNQYYQEQLEIADILVANKTDQCTPEELALFDRLVEDYRPIASGKVSRGQVDLDWLQLPHSQRARTSILQTPATTDSVSKPDTPILDPVETCRRDSNRSGEFASCGWLFNDSLRFDKHAILSLFNAINTERIKASLHTNQGDIIVNAGTDGIQTTKKEQLEHNRVEVIMRGDPDWDKIEQALLACVEST